MPFKEYQIEDLKKYWTITEIAEELDVNTSTIRFWETVFPQLVPKRRHITAEKRGWRKYSKKDRNFVHRVHDLLHVKKYTIEGAKQVLKNG